METNPFLITPDLSEAVETAGGIAPGVYSVRVSNPEIKDSKSTPGNKYIQWDLTIFGAEGELARFNNWKVKYRTMLSGKGAGILKGFYKACTGQDFPGGAFDWSLLVGSEIQATLVTQKDMNTGEPTDFSEVKSVKPLNKVQ